MSYRFNPFTGNFDQVGSVSSAGPQGAIQFSNGFGGFAADGANLIWDDVNNLLDLNNNRIINVADPTNAQDAATKNYIDTTFIPLSQKAQPLGVASLDAGGKVPVQQLPNSIMQYIGVWNATTNIPALADGAGNPDESIGDVYRVSVAGTRDLGSGSQTFEVGDYVILNNSKIWEKSDTTDAVASVNGQVGIVLLDTDDIPEGTTNLYFTNARAQTASVADLITDGVTTVAPSQNAVFDALALKANTTLNNLTTTSIPTSLHFNTSNPGNAVLIDTPNRPGDAGFSLTLRVGEYFTGFGEFPLRLQGGIEDSGSVRGPIELQGKTRLQNGSQGTIGHVWTSTDVNGTGTWAAPVSSDLSAEQRTITTLEETNKSLTLAQAPLVPNAVILQIQGAPAQIYGLDYTVSGTTLSWNGLGLDGLLEENDEVSIVYSV